MSGKPRHRRPLTQHVPPVYSIRTATLAADDELNPASAFFQFLDCGGADRIVKLGTEAYHKGSGFFIFNASDADETITVTNDADGEIVRLSRGQFAQVVTDGATWAVLSNNKLSLANVAAGGSEVALVATSEAVQVVDPQGSAIDLLLAPEAPDQGNFRIVVNTADADEPITVKEDGDSTVISVVGRGRSGIYECDGSTWRRVGGTASEMALPAFAQADVTVDQTAVALVLAGGQAGDVDIPMPRSGSVTGIVVKANDARTAGTLTVDVTIGGTATGLQAVLDATNATKHGAFQAEGLDTFSELDLIGVDITTDGSWAPTTADITVTVFVTM